MTDETKKLRVTHSYKSELAEQKKQTKMWKVIAIASMITVLGLLFLIIAL